ncbi:hypothetical protein TNCV_2677381 [Trichonephila clavipes]|nr:hypothetical protein TNCV_2677381 [Trichonephila clavipes]
MLKEDHSANEAKRASQAELKDMAKNGFQKCFDDLYKPWQKANCDQYIRAFCNCACSCNSELTSKILYFNKTRAFLIDIPICDDLSGELLHRWLGCSGQNNQALFPWPPRSPDSTSCVFSL